LSSQRARRRSLDVLADEIIACRRCPRLVAYMGEVARKRKREFASWQYWARPLPGFGDPKARLILVGLAPAAHGGTRTGRVFTGDSSGAFLMGALHRAGFASQPSSTTREDGLVLTDAFITVAVRCAPPENKPTPVELRTCQEWLASELRVLSRAQVIVALGRIAFDAILRTAPELGARLPAPRPQFAHGARAVLERDDAPPLHLVASYHPSRQNTNTGKLTVPMFDRIFAAARAALRVT
jgi:uracil-DNA glycosylase family 4